MVVISKQVFDRTIQDLSCGDLLHLWQPHSCSKAFFVYVRGCSRGISIFFFIMYGVQYIILRKRLTKKDIKDILKDFIRSIMFGHIFASVPLLYNCIQRNLLGSFDYYLTTFGTGTVMGLTTVLSPKSRFSIEATYFIILAYINVIKFLSFKHILPRNKAAGLPYFMLSNSLMMTLLWMKQNTNNLFKISWIFSPYSQKDESKQRLCCHKGVCSDSFMDVTGKYLLIGVTTSLIKIILKLLKSKDKNPMNIINASYLKDPLFWAAYVGVHKGIHCALTLFKGKDSYYHALIGGFISGLSYLISPNLSLPASQTVLIVMMLFNELKKRFKLPKFPYQFFCFVISLTILIHFIIVNKKIASRFVLSMLEIGTNGRVNAIINTIGEIAKKDKIL